MVEVKSSDFRQKKHFAQGNVFLPDGYVDGLNQLKSADLLLQLLEECTGGKQLNETRVHKILFTPNLEKERYQKWENELKKENYQRVKETMGDVIQLFRDDIQNSFGKNSPTLYASLKNILQHTDSRIPIGIFEAYAPIIAAFKSIVSIRSENMSQVCQWNSVIISEGEAVLIENLRIETQNPVTKKLCLNSHC